MSLSVNIPGHNVEVLLERHSVFVDTIDNVLQEFGRAGGRPCHTLYSETTNGVGQQARSQVCLKAPAVHG